MGTGTMAFSAGRLSQAAALLCERGGRKEPSAEERQRQAVAAINAVLCGA